MGFSDIFKTKTRQKKEIIQPEAEAAKDKEPEKEIVRHEFTEEDRQSALIKREMLAIQREKLAALRARITELRADQEAKRLEAQIERMENQAKPKYYEDPDEEDDEEDDDEDDDSVDNMFKLAAIGFMNGFSKNKNTPPTTQSPRIEPTANLEITDAEINEFIDNNADMAAKAQKMPDSFILKTLQNKMGLDAATAKRALELLKKRDLKINVVKPNGKK